MKRWKRILSILLVCCLVVGLLSTTALATDTVASGTCGDNLTWTLDSAGTLTVSGTGAMDDWKTIEGVVPWGDWLDNIQAVVIEDGVTHIGQAAFFYHKQLTSVIIPSTVETIGESAFNQCTNLRTINIPDSVQEIGDCAFEHCLSLVSITIPKEITTIKKMTFWGCTRLATITIPSNVISIEDDAFYYCNNLSDVYFEGSEEQWSKITIGGNCAALTTATIHYNNTGLDDGIPGKDMAYGSVMFLTGWSNTEKTVTFADTPISYSVVDETDLTFLVSWPEICYSYVQVTSDSAYHLINIEPVESHIGVASAATENTLTIDGTQYYIAGDGQIILDAFVGRRVLYHLLDGVIVGIENAASVDESDYKIKTGEEGKLYAAFKSLPGETISYHFISSDSSVVSFSSDGGSSESINWSITPTDPMEAYNGIHTADTFYAMKPGTATVTCTTSDGIQYTRTIIVQSEEDGTGASNNYNVPVYEVTEEESARAELWNLLADFNGAYQDFCEAYAQAVIKEAEAQGYDPTGGYTAQAEAMMEADASNDENNKFIKFYDIDDSLKVYAYRALCQMLDDVGELEGVDFSSISFSDEFTLGSNIVNQVASQIKSHKETITMGDVEVEIRCGVFFRTDNRLGVMEIRRVTGGPTYEAYLFPNESVAKEAVEQYVAALETLGNKAVKNAYTTVIQELTGLSLSSMNEKVMSDALKRLNNKFSKVVIKGFDVGEVLTVLENLYDQYNDCKKLVNIKYSPTMADTTKSKLEKIVNFDMLDPVDFETTATTKNAAKKLTEVETCLINALEEYFYKGKISDETLGKIDKNPFSWRWSGKCPIEIEVYDSSNTQIGYAGDDIWFTDDILIERRGEEIRVYSKEPVSVCIIGTDYGMMSFTVEEYTDGHPKGRVNYYNIPLQENQTYTVSLADSSLSSVADVIMMDEQGTIIPAFEYISASMDAKVQIDAVASSEEVGIVIGDGNYVKGDLVTLTAYANDGYQFVGWFDGDDCVSISNTYAFVAYEDVSLIGQYIKVFDFLITFDPNGGTVNPSTLTTSENGMLPELPTPVRVGYTFTGWYTDPVGGERITADTVFNADTTVYAHWTFVGNDSPSSPPSAPSNGSASYSVSVPSNVENGTVTATPKSASEGDIVTITVTPDEGYELEELTVTARNGRELKLTDKGNGRYTFTMPASKVTIFASFAAIVQENEPKPAEWSNLYTDVPEGIWYYDAVKYVTEHGLMGGTNDGTTFSPTMTTTRGMIMTILARMNGVNTEGGAVWYEKGMEWAVANGVSDGTNPEKDITRQELVTMLWRYAGEPSGTRDLSGYPDAAETDTWAVDAMKWAAEHGVITHTGEGLLNPTGPATRMEVATILMRFCENFVK